METELLPPRGRRMRVLLSLALAALLLPASGSAQEAYRKFEPRLSQALEEQRILLTCSRLDPEMAKGAAEAWLMVISAAQNHLEKQGAKPADMVLFAQRLDRDSLTSLDLPFREVVAFCGKHDWPRMLTELRFTFRFD